MHALILLRRLLDDGIKNSSGFQQWKQALTEGFSRCTTGLLVIFTAFLVIGHGGLERAAAEEFSAKLRTMFHNNRSRTGFLSKSTNTDFVGNFRYIPYQDEKIQTGLDIETYYRNRLYGQTDVQDITTIRPVLGVRLSTLQYQMELSLNRNENRQNSRLIKQVRSMQTSSAVIKMDHLFLPLVITYSESEHDSGGTGSDQTKSISMGTRFSTIFFMDGLFNYNESLLLRRDPEIYYFSRQRAMFATLKGSYSPVHDLNLNVKGYGGIVKNYDSKDTHRRFIEDVGVNLTSDAKPTNYMTISDNAQVVLRKDKTGRIADNSKLSNYISIHLAMQEKARFSFSNSLERSDYGRGEGNQFVTNNYQLNKKIIPQIDMTLAYANSASENNTMKEQEGSSTSSSILLFGRPDLLSNAMVKISQNESKAETGSAGTMQRSLYSEYSRRLKRLQNIRLTFLNNQFDSAASGKGSFSEQAALYSIAINDKFSASANAAHRQATSQGLDELSLSCGAILNLTRYVYGGLSISRVTQKFDRLPETDNFSISSSFNLILGKRTYSELSWNFNKARSDVSSRSQSYKVMVNYNLRLF